MEALEARAAGSVEDLSSLRPVGAGTRALQRPSCSDTTPTPLMHIRRPSASTIVPIFLSKGSPPEAICQRDSGTETTAPMSSSKETLIPLSLLFTHGVSPACSPAIDNTRRFPGKPLCVPVGGRWFRRGAAWLSGGQSRRRWPKPPQLKQPCLLAACRTAVGSCFSSFMETFLTSRIKSSMDWVASVFSGFGLPVIPQAKRARRSRSDTPALHLISATSWAAWNRSISCPVDSCGPYAPSNRFLNSSKEFSFLVPLGRARGGLGRSAGSERPRRDRAQYASVIRQYFDEEWAEPAPAASPLRRTWYLPHHKVYQGSGDERKCRVVFDAAALYDGITLNSQLEEGRNLQIDLLRAILRFHRLCVGLQADIEKMYLQIRVREEDRDVRTNVRTTSGGSADTVSPGCVLA
ncbi:hypothetical protein T06_14535 [Trichinella sp. T6]|nr:hypothetical protein T06_14535 [Trichinella sp. T6]